MKTTRRTFIGGIAATTVPAGVSLAAVTHSSTDENPALVAAYARFIQARDEVKKAENDLDWLADEWRHKWPLAPEAILGGANAFYGLKTTLAERDIIGRYLSRDTADLTKRLSRKQREELPRTCFAVERPSVFQDTITRWEDREPTGRTEKATARRRAEKVKVLAEYRHKLALSEAYFAETKRIREVSGVNAMKAKIADGKKAMQQAAQDVADAQAMTGRGLRMKAVALEDDAVLLAFAGQQSGVGHAGKFIKDFLDFVGRDVA